MTATAAASVGVKMPALMPTMMMIGRISAGVVRIVADLRSAHDAFGDTGKPSRRARQVA